MNVYPGPELMGHSDLMVDLSNMEPLISPESLKELENEYLKVGSMKCLTTNWFEYKKKLTGRFMLDHGEELRRLDDENSRNRTTAMDARTQRSRQILSYRSTSYHIPDDRSTFTSYKHHTFGVHI